MILMVSPNALLSNGVPNSELVDILVELGKRGTPVAVVSNHDEPHWFDDHFRGSNVVFVKEVGRQNGQIIPFNAGKFLLNPFDVVVLASTDVDVQMGKNGGALLLGASWAADQAVAALGVQIQSPVDLAQVLALISGWPGAWWFSANAPYYNVRALSDLSTKKYGLTGAQQAFALQLTNTIKNGGAKLNALLAVTAKSLLMDGFHEKDGLVWGVYPSSSSSNNDTEVLSDFTHRLRTTVSRVRFAKRGEPLFIRHTPSHKRSAGGGGDRTDPTDQILSIHLNPFYKISGRLRGKNVVVVDDCTTYGVSFGVAASFLRAAGAASVTGVALGKFGSQLRYYEIDINSDPYKPVSIGGFNIKTALTMSGSNNGVVQSSLQSLLD